MEGRQKITRTTPRKISNTIQRQSSIDDVDSDLKGELRKVRGEYENLMKSVWLLSLGTQNLEDVMSMEKLRNNCDGLDYDCKQSISKEKAPTFVRATN